MRLTPERFDEIRKRVHENAYGPISSDIIMALLDEIDALKLERDRERAEVEALREALVSECPCTCRPHALGKDKPLTCLRCKALAARQPTEGKP